MVDMPVSAPMSPDSTIEEQAAQPDLAALLERYLDGDARAFRRLYRELQPRLYRRALGLVRDREEAHDVVQTAMLRAHRSIDRFEFPKSGKTGRVIAWYSTIVRNVAIDRLRSRAAKLARVQSSLDVATEPVSAEPSAEEAMVEREHARSRAMALHAEVAQLSASARELIEHRLAGYSLAQVAEQLGIRHGTARVRAHRAHRILADRLAGLRGGAACVLPAPSPG